MPAKDKLINYVDKSLGSVSKSQNEIIKKSPKSKLSLLMRGKG